MSTTTLATPEAPIQPLVSIRDARVRVEPGQIATTDISVRNPSGIVETYDIQALGPAAAWSSVDPLSVSLFPGDEQDVTISFQPPMSSRIVAGDYAVGIQVTSQVRPESTATAETVVTVPPFYRFRLVQAQSAYSVRTKATLLVRVVNEGNSTVTFGVQTEDPEGYISVKPKEPQFTLSPGESRWVEINVSVAPKIIGSGFDTRSFIITVTPLHDVDLDLPIVDEDAEEIGASIVHRPFVRVRLGVLGRLILLLSVLGLLAGFLISRYLNNLPADANLAPLTPEDLGAGLTVNARDVILTWSPSLGATSYDIYAEGAAGDPAPAPTPTVVVEAPSGSAVTRSGRIPQVVAVPDNLPTPVCQDCTLVAEVNTGTTRHVVESVPPGLACYRIAAKRGDLQSLFSPRTCIEVPGIIDLNANGVPDSEEDTPPTILPCPPSDPTARPVSGSTVAVIWQPSVAPPLGFITPDDPAAAAAFTAASLAGSESQAQDDPITRGGPIGPDKLPSEGAQVRVCDPTQEITGWALQRKIFTGWSNVDPAPAAKDTATEVQGLEPGTRYCFRMASVSAQGQSEYTKRFCATTPGSGGGNQESDPGSGQAAPAVPANPVDPTGTAPTAPASVVIEKLR